MRVVKLPVDPADQRQPPRGVIQRDLGLLVGDVAHLKRQQGTDNLKVVRHPMLKLAKQQFAAFGQPLAAFALLGKTTIGALHQVDQHNIDRHDRRVEKQGEQDAAG